MSLLTSKHLHGPTFTATTINAVHQDWSKVLGRRPEDYEQMYRDMMDLLSRSMQPARKSFLSSLLGKSASSDATLAYRAAICFGSDKFLKAYGARQAAHMQLNLIHDDYLSLLDRLIEAHDREVTDVHLPRDTGRWGDLAAAAALVYFYHTDFGHQGQRLRAEAAEKMPALLRNFPYLDSNLLLSLMSHHPDIIPHAAGLVTDRLMIPDDPDDDRNGALCHLALDMTGFHANREDVYHKNGPAILQAVLRDATDWPTPKLAELRRLFVLYPLDIDIGTAEQEIAKAQARIAREDAKIASGFAGLDGPLSPQRLEQFARKRIKEQQAIISAMQSDFEGIKDKRFNTAARRLAVSPAARKSISVLAQGLPQELSAPLADLLTRAEAIRKAPKTLPMPKASGNRFKDFGFKLMVIEELMYVQKLLTPAFDIRVFAKEWDKRQISVEDDGYEIIPEAKTYFKNLSIPDDLLAKVEVLIQGSGLSGGDGYMRELYPFWDPGSGDGPVPVTNKAVADLDLLPNLKCIAGLEHEANTPKPAKLLNALEARGINMIDEARAVFGAE